MTLLAVRRILGDFRRPADERRPRALQSVRGSVQVKGKKGTRVSRQGCDALIRV
ncbi:hypothetical protein [Halodurantibacterium flavum]|uniref:Uncharacterized protein n=1 Tax=Halodurantibacterium flavum TaxID=1382802 RepID=A0ABW4S733_9RHOB